MSKLHVETGSKCKLCGKAASQIGNAVECRCCGHYSLSKLAALVAFSPEVQENRHILSAIARYTNAHRHAEFVLTEEMMTSLPAVLKNAPMNIPRDTDVDAKAQTLLRQMQRRSSHPGADVNLEPDVDWPLAVCRNGTEFRFCLDYLLENGWIEAPKLSMTGGPSHGFRISPSGWVWLSGRGSGHDTAQAFIAMSFAPKFDDLLRNGLMAGIEKAGYLPLRIDKKEHSNRIDDEIISELRRSKLAVVDLSDQNPGAYFEAGFAMGIGIPVVWTCSRGEVEAKQVHFDTRQYSIVTWTGDDWSDFVGRLSVRITSLLGQGPRTLPG